MQMYFLRPLWQMVTHKLKDMTLKIRERIKIFNKNDLINSFNRLFYNILIFNLFNKNNKTFM